ncbi:MAG: iron-sulfur cluster assembly scaffold protein [Nanoarchaeota archaeon]|nr:iron-sulfur cluster assembly scaffold protein [Nanoarchaeota archaeon]MBU4352343.1 iron-sulfur cluster assembly scaffold protein [Nanoarchaeota archaeon]MBU4455991.1 iron-sulfur cluster assembly scaffold protein [Nanoarchaeota archaeon]MCG2719886.1 iron-sulfur cluster assembly scaffold protein [Nanoarchaeota archaeon]
MYGKKVMKHFTNPKNAGCLKNADGVGEVGNVRCGDILRLYIKVKDNKIINAKFKTYGCVAAIASSDILCDMAKGKTLEEAEKITNKDIVEQLGDLPSIKVHCSVMGASALKKAIEDYRNKKK